MEVRELLKLVARKAGLVRTDDSRPVQRVQLELIGNEGGDIPRVQNYGLTSNAGGTGLALCLTVNGHRVVVALDDPDNRPTDLKDGETKVWHRNGDYIHLKNGNEIEVKAASKLVVNTERAEVNASARVDVKSPTIKLIASRQVYADSPLLKCSGQVSDGVGTMAQMRAIFDGHNHPGDSGGSTSVPNQKMA